MYGDITLIALALAYLFVFCFARWRNAKKKDACEAITYYQNRWALAFQNRRVHAHWTLATGLVRRIQEANVVNCSEFDAEYFEKLLAIFQFDVILPTDRIWLREVFAQRFGHERGVLKDTYTLRNWLYTASGDITKKKEK